MQFLWLEREDQIEQAARFFESGVRSDPSYISHSELMWGRATSPTQWSSELYEKLHEELSEIVDGGTSQSKRVARCIVDGELMGVAILDFQKEVPIPFGVLEDIVIKIDARRTGIGQAFIDWICDRMQEAGLRRIYLESGLTNEAAHHWFERNGFHQVSVVMMAPLAAK
jgi:ribosomal protein S18 acetylase RimI-like enzyme